MVDAGAGEAPSISLRRPRKRAGQPPLSQGYLACKGMPHPLSDPPGEKAPTPGRGALEQATAPSVLKHRPSW